MANNPAQFTNEAQDAARSAFGALQGVLETQSKIMQQLGGVQHEMIRQAVEISNDQLQLIGRIRDPREYSSAQADLARDHGQRYVNSIKKAVDIIAGAWQEYGDRLETTLSTATNQSRSASRKAA